jgi:hypothetical protein
MSSGALFDSGIQLISHLTIIFPPSLYFQDFMKNLCSYMTCVCVFFISLVLNVTAKQLALLIQICEATGSNFSPETSYPKWGSSVPAGNRGILPQRRSWPVPSMSFPIHYSHLTLYSVSCWQHHQINHKSINTLLMFGHVEISYI